jgi:hypothetical protein
MSGLPALLNDGMLRLGLQITGACIGVVLCLIGIAEGIDFLTRDYPGASFEMVSEMTVVGWLLVLYGTGGCIGSSCAMVYVIIRDEYQTQDIGEEAD